MPARATDQKPKILYVEDNRENRMLVRAVLEAAGYTIVEAEDGLAGIEAAVREQPALILLDINLPGVDGYEIVAILKSFPNLASTPVIAVTAYAMQGDRQRTLVAGCDGYIQKPIDVDTFPRQVAEFLAGKRERIESREEGVYLRELNQRLVYRLLNQVEELKRLNQHFVRRAGQLADLHHAVQDITSELGVEEMLVRLLRGVSRAIGTTSLVVELDDPAGVRVAVEGEAAGQPRSVLAGTGIEPTDDMAEVEWSLPLTVRDRRLGTMVARHVLPPGAKADEEQLLKIVADQVAIAVENARLYDRVAHRAAEQESLVESGRLLTGTLQVSEILQHLSELVRARLGADVVRILIQEPDRPGEFHLHAQAGVTEHGKEVSLHVEDGDDGLIGWIMRHRRSIALPDVLEQPNEVSRLVQGRRLRVVPRHSAVLRERTRWRHDDSVPRAPRGLARADGARGGARDLGDHRDPQRASVRGDPAAAAGHRDPPRGQPGRELDARAHRSLATLHARARARAGCRHRRRVAPQPGRQPLRSDRGLSRAQASLRDVHRGADGSG